MSDDDDDPSASDLGIRFYAELDPAKRWKVVEWVRVVDQRRRLKGWLSIVENDLGERRYGEFLSHKEHGSENLTAQALRELRSKLAN